MYTQEAKLKTHVKKRLLSPAGVRTYIAPYSYFQFVRCRYVPLIVYRILGRSVHTYVGVVPA